jgi:SAM-dependent methyltransferase
MDYGSGFGFYGLRILECRKDSRVTFVDINAANLALIRRLAGLCGFAARMDTALVEDERAAGLEFSHDFDAIVSMGVLHHTPHARAIVEKLDAFLKPGGRFVAMLYNFRYLQDAEEGSGRCLNPATFGPHTDPSVGKFVNPYSDVYDESKALRLFLNYEMESIDHPTPHYDTYVFKKPQGP